MGSLSTVALALVLLAAPDKLPEEGTPTVGAAKGTVVQRGAPAEVSEDSHRRLTREAQAAQDGAAHESRQGKYGAAAQLLEETAKGWRKGLEGTRDAYVLAELDRAATGYRRREALAKKSATDMGARRALLLDLIAPGGRSPDLLVPANGALEQAKLDDPRVGKLLEELRRDDPVSKAFFARSVKVVGGPSPGVDLNDLQILLDALVTGLRQLGLQANATSGADLLTVTASSPQASDVGADLGVSGLNAGSIRATARWTDPKGEPVVAPIELSASAAGFSASAATVAALRRAAEQAPQAVLRRWLESTPH